MSTGNKDVDDKINLTIIGEIAGEDSTTDISKTLFRAMNEGLSELYYKITLNTKDFFSARLYTLSCSAYCSAYYYYFNFNLQTGELLKIEDVINGKDLDSLRTLVLRDKIKALELDKKEKESFLSEIKIDSANYDFILDLIQECSKQVNIEKFLLSKNELQIIDDCEFPHVVTGMQPVYELKYTYKKIRKLLNPLFVEKMK